MGRLGDRVVGHGLRAGARQPDTERGAQPRARRHVDPATVLGDDLVADRKPKTGALAHALGGEERI